MKPRQQHADRFNLKSKRAQGNLSPFFYCLGRQLKINLPLLEFFESGKIGEIKMYRGD